MVNVGGGGGGGGAGGRSGVVVVVMGVCVVVVVVGVVFSLMMLVFLPLGYCRSGFCYVVISIFGVMAVVNVNQNTLLSLLTLLLQTTSLLTLLLQTTSLLTLLLQTTSLLTLLLQTTSHLTLFSPHLIINAFQIDTLDGPKVHFDVRKRKKSIQERLC